MLTYVSPEISDKQRKDIENIFEEFIKKEVQEREAEISDWSCGWTIETDVPFAFGEEGKSGLVFAVLIGWKHEDAYLVHRAQSDAQSCWHEIGYLTNVLGEFDRSMPTKCFGIRKKTE